MLIYIGEHIIDLLKPKIAQNYFRLFHIKKNHNEPSKEAQFGHPDCEPQCNHAEHCIASK